MCNSFGITRSALSCRLGTTPIFLRCPLALLLYFGLYWAVFWIVWEPAKVHDDWSVQHLYQIIRLGTIFLKLNDYVLTTRNYYNKQKDLMDHLMLHPKERGYWQRLFTYTEYRIDRILYGRILYWHGTSPIIPLFYTYGS